MGIDEGVIAAAAIGASSVAGSVAIRDGNFRAVVASRR